ncbi:MAG: autotransporter strand-loop-strand O-heptosyltransferase [Schwartzia sp.]|nr:autotransporter strand-loop-strand O-heptosyltransferase [Schwartzia sp. (in: firmicutes)]
MENNAANNAPAKEPYMVFDPPAVPTMEADVPGIRYDFNLGLRVSVPQGNYRVRFVDRDAALTVYDAAASGVLATSTKRYFVNFRLEVYETLSEEEKKKRKAKDESFEDRLVFSHDYDAKGKRVLMKVAHRAMGDVLAWFPYVEAFRLKHDCELYVEIHEKYIEILRAGYPDIRFIAPGEKRPDELYATYYVGLFAPWDDRNLQPTDWRVVGLQAHAAYLLGVAPAETKPRLLPSKGAKKLRPKEPYVCIATQATAQCKYWNNAQGWMDTVAHLKKLGYRVLCVDRDRVTVNGLYGNSIPYGAEDFTGDFSLQDRVDLISGAAFFIGLPSGLSWLAWGAGVPVILIAGFTSPGTEFSTPYRVQQFHTCHSCGNDQRNEHVYDDFGACPHHRGTDREFECTRCIAPDFVKETIDRLVKDWGFNK